MLLFAFCHILFLLASTKFAIWILVIVNHTMYDTHLWVFSVLWKWCLIPRKYATYEKTLCYNFAICIIQTWVVFIQKRLVHEHEDLSFFKFLSPTYAFSFYTVYKKTFFVKIISRSANWIFSMVIMCGRLSIVITSFIRRVGWKFASQCLELVPDFCGDKRYYSDNFDARRSFTIW